MSSAMTEQGQKQALSQYLSELQAVLESETEQVETLLQEEDHCLQELKRIQALYYQEKRYLEQLDRQRCPNIQD
ncbi:MAG: DNA primase, partial [Thermosynechococcaceae cyanobacterium]